jgi:Ca2+-transporting ATPase
LLREPAVPQVKQMRTSPVPAELSSGLDEQSASCLLAEVGPNEIARAAGTSPWRLLLAQFGSPLIWLLLGACVVSAFLREFADAIAIGVILIVNGVVGFLQEYRAERALQALRAMTAPRARVIREGAQKVIQAAEVVPGDLLLLEAGDVVAADAGLIEAFALSTSEAALTGESLPVDKRPEPSPASVSLAERRDTVFMGTAVATGTGLARVTATGMRTELGKIAHLLGTAEETETPLQARLARTSRVLLYVCLSVVAATAVVGLVRGTPPLEVLLSAVSLAVAAVPEGLPAVVTIALAIGVQRMAARHVLIRRLPAVETLGSATVICTDKTGTLTTGVMAVREVWGADHRAVLASAAACCDADLGPDGRGGTGDPTEVALLAAAAERGVTRRGIEEVNPRRSVQPFDPERKRMSIFRADGRNYVKGALESLLPLCKKGAVGAIVANEQMAERGLRVLGVAEGCTAEETDLRLLGLVGIADPPRTEAIAAVAAARSAGIRTVMITGDHAITAQAIARELGIIGPQDDPAEVVHARATPEDKLRIVRGWKARGAVVAMTGDGVNDAPALREAHIGIAMGRTGTEVTREASDMVLADDNFASIVAAVREGRGIFDNIRKALVYLLAGSTAELAFMFGAAISGLPVPLHPLQILWINLVTDGFPALALVMDPTDPHVLERPPRHPSEPMLGRAEWKTLALAGLVQATVTLLVFAWTLKVAGVSQARTLAFASLVFGQLFLSFAARSPSRLFWEVGAFTNLRLLAVVALSAVLQLGIHHVPAAGSLFQVQALSGAGWALALLLGIVPVTVIELAKLGRRHLGTGRGQRPGRADVSAGARATSSPSSRPRDGSLQETP